MSYKYEPCPEVICPKCDHGTMNIRVGINILVSARCGFKLVKVEQNQKQ